jgi:hypothetical protein
MNAERLPLALLGQPCSHNLCLLFALLITEHITDEHQLSTTIDVMRYVRRMILFAHQPTLVFASHKFDTTSKLCSQGILELLPGLLRQRETFPPCLELNQFTVIVLRTATNSYQATVAVAWHRVTPPWTHLLLTSCRRINYLREALDTSHFPSSFLTMSLSPSSNLAHVT